MQGFDPHDSVCAERPVEPSGPPLRGGIEGLRIATAGGYFADPSAVHANEAVSIVAAALRTSGLGVDDARLDALVSRSRASAWLPETRLRGMRLWDDAAHTTTLATTDTANF